MILILTETKDIHADRVEAKLRRRGEDLLRFDWSEFPGAASLAIRFEGRDKRVLLRTGAGDLDLSEVKSAWLRRPTKPVIAAEIEEPLMKTYADEECFQVVQDTWNSLDTAWLPGPIAAIRRADNKQLQLGLALGLGMEVPPTLITNDPDEFLEFYRRHDGRLIDKQPSVILAASQRTGNELMRYTQPVTTRDVGYARRIRYSPMLFQGYVPKRFELRITVIDGRVLAAEIHSQTTKRTQLDWRHYDWGHTPYRVHDLPAEVEAQCLAMVERLGLRFGAIDMIVTPDGRYVFLEINPNGQWMWIEDETGLPLSDVLCDALATPGSSRRPAHSAPVAAAPLAKEMVS